MLRREMSDNDPPGSRRRTSEADAWRADTYVASYRPNPPCRTSAVGRPTRETRMDSDGVRTEVGRPNTIRHKAAMLAGYFTFRLLFFIDNS